MRSLVAIFPLAVGAAAALQQQLQVLPALRRACRTSLSPLRMGFEVEGLDEQAVGEMGIVAWPGLEKRTAPFEQSASGDEMMMIYVKEGTAKIADGDETATVEAGQLVMLSDGGLSWSDIGDGGLTLMSTTAPLSDVMDDTADDLSFNPLKASGGDSVDADDDPKDITPKEAALLLASGLAAGALLSFGVKIFQVPDSAVM